MVLNMRHMKVIQIHVIVDEPNCGNSRNLASANVCMQSWMNKWESGTEAKMNKYTINNSMDDKPPAYRPEQQFTRYDTRTSDTMQVEESLNVMNRTIPMSNGLRIAVLDPPGQQSQPMAAMIASTIAGSSPVLLQCPFCSRVVTTECRPQVGCLAWLCCWLCVAFGLVCGCCLYPFCSGSLRDVKHVCPMCRKIVAVHKRI